MVQSPIRLIVANPMAPVWCKRNGLLNGKDGDGHGEARRPAQRCHAHGVRGQDRSRDKPEIMKARDSHRSGRPAAMVFVALLIALPGFLVTARATRIPPGAPPTLDRFLAAVRGATPPAAHVLVAGARPALV